MPESWTHMPITDDRSTQMPRTWNHFNRQPAEIEESPRPLYRPRLIVDQPDQEIFDFLSTGKLAQKIIQLDLLQRRGWEMRHPGTRLNTEQLLRELHDEVEVTSDFDSEIFLANLDILHDLRATMRARLTRAREQPPINPAREEVGEMRRRELGHYPPFHHNFAPVLSSSSRVRDDQNTPFRARPFVQGPGQEHKTTIHEVHHTIHEIRETWHTVPSQPRYEPPCRPFEGHELGYRQEDDELDDGSSTSVTAYPAEHGTWLTDPRHSPDPQFDYESNAMEGRHLQERERFRYMDLPPGWEWHELQMEHA